MKNETEKEFIEYPRNEIELAILEIARSFEQGRWDGCYNRVKEILKLK